MQLIDFNSQLRECKPLLFRLVRKTGGLSEESHELLTYFRDYLISLIDVALNEGCLPVFNRMMLLSLKVLI